MKRKKFAISFDNEQLKKLVLDENTCVILNHCTHHLALHPYHLGNITESLKHTLYKGIAKFDKTLGGILLGYQDIKLLSTVGSINNDACFIHVDISADFFLFKPEVGKTVTGIVNKKSEDHVGCLVHEAFNVSLPKPPEDDDWMGSLVQIGHQILFQINFTNLEGRLPYIRGTLISILSELDSGISTGEDTKSNKLSKKKSKRRKVIFDSHSECEEEETTPVKKKKNRKSEEGHKNVTIDEFIEPEGTIDSNEMHIENTIKHKKRKRKHMQEEDEDIETVYVGSSKFSNINGDKRKGKHRDPSNCDIETSYETSEISKSSIDNNDTTFEHKSLKRSKKKKRHKPIIDFSDDEREVEQITNHKHKKKHKARKE